MIRRFTLVLLLPLALAGCAASGRYLKVLRTNPDPAMRVKAIEGLAGLTFEGEKRAQVVEELASAALDINEEVRVKAIEALGKIGGPEAREALVRVLLGEDYKRAALRELTEADKLGGEIPDALLSIGRIQTDLDELKKAERALTDCFKIVSALPPYEAGQHLTSLKYALDNLRMRYEARDDQEAAKRVAAKLTEVEAKIAETGAQGGGMPPMFPY